MAPDDSFDALMARLRDGDPQAAEAIFQRYARRLIGLARNRLDARVRQKVDPEDVMQSALKSFFVRHAHGEYDLAGWDSLWALLTVITLRKCGYRARHFRTAGRDVGREMVPAGHDDSGASWEALAREPTPDEAAVLAETVEGIFRGLDERDRHIVELGLQGYRAREISERVGVAERSVYRVLERLKGKLQRLGEGDE